MAKKQNSPFVHLHVHSHYSILDGLTKIDELLDHVVKMDMDAVALTDHGVLYGAVEFYKKAKERNIKPIIGCEIYTAVDGMLNKRPNVDNKSYHLILLVENETGYRNLVQLITKAHLEGFYYKPRIDDSLLEKHSEGLIALSACLQGKIPRLILSGNKEQAKELALYYNKLFGKDRFYLEIQHHPNIKEQAKVNEEIIKIHKETGIPLVATCDSHYLLPEDAETQDILMSISTGSDINDPDRLTIKEDDFSLRSPEKMQEFFKETPQALESTERIKDLCNLELSLGKTILPHFPLPKGQIPDKELYRLCKEGIEKRYSSKEYSKVNQRLKEEIEIITGAKLSSYFLIVQDFVNWAKENNIVVGPGRGSAGGSIVAYLLGITNIDPLRYDLLFERFLNPGRAKVSLPDIDLDFADRRRDEVIAYIAQKYGEDRVAQIITFGTMAARAAVRDVGRVLNFSYSYCDRIAKMIPFNTTLKEVKENSVEFRQLYDTDEDARRLIDHAERLEGVIRHASTHACGVVISDKSLYDIVPLQHPTQNDDAVVTQYEMNSVESIGLLKMDLLGLKNLTIIEDTLKRIYVLHRKNIDIEGIPLSDQLTFNLLREGKTVGVFQLESAGFQRYLKQLQPTNIEEIIAMIALYRPGPMKFIPEYIERKQGKREINYLHPLLKPILEPTYGVCIAGESVIQTENSGKIYQINELVNSEKNFNVQSYDFSKNKFLKGTVSRKFNNGIKRVYEIKLRTGKKIKATSDHLFLTPQGWRKLSSIKIGDFLGTPKKLSTGNKNFSEQKIKILSYLIADGSFSNKSDCYLVNKNKLILKDFKKCIESSFSNTTVRFTTHLREVQRAIPQKTNPNNTPYHEPNEVLKWMQKLGLKSKRGGLLSSQKHIPSFVFELKENLIATFLASYWDCNGGITKKTAYLKTISPKIAFGVQTLLLKLGINSYAYQGSKYLNKNKKERVPYLINVYDLDLFYSKVGKLMITDKKYFLEKTNRERGSIIICNDYVPRKIFSQKINEYIEKNQISQRKICSILGINRGFFRHKERRLNVEVAQKINSFLQDKELEKYFQNQIRWEDVMEIKYIGKENVYDIEVRETHNFIANNILIHNCVYQEQVMRIARDLAGYDLAEADILRKAIGKKIEELLQSQKEKFINGIEGNGIKKEVGEKLWSWIEPFAQYSFNKSHAAAYAQIAYQTAYLKAHYPKEFMSALLTAEQNDTERIGFLINDCRKMSIDVLPPDINESFIGFSIVPDKPQIRFGLSAIKNVGIKLVENIVEERKANGKFHSIDDFLSRIDSQTLNRKSMESLIKAGSFDKLKERNELLHNIEHLLEYGREKRKNKSSGQGGLFDAGNVKTDLKLEKAPPLKEEEKLGWEKELLGLFITNHPLEYLKEKTENGSITIKEAKRQASDTRVRIGVIVSGVKKIITKSGEAMLFLRVEDLTDNMEIIVFPRALKSNGTLFEEGKPLFISGKVSHRDESPKIICDKAEEIK